MTVKHIIVFVVIFVSLNAQSISIIDFLNNSTQSMPAGCTRVDSRNTCL
jgi:hypothetical protein